MTYQRLAYDDASTAAEMSVDCHAVEEALHLPQRPSAAQRAARAAVTARAEHPVRGLPPRDREADLEVSEAAARLAAAMHLHLD